jgi:hypothetical protein
VKTHFTKKEKKIPFPHFCFAKLNQRMLSPPPPKMETIASKLACFIKQTNFFIQRKMIEAIYIGIYLHTT